MIENRRPIKDFTDYIRTITSLDSKVITVEPKVLDFLQYFMDNYGIEQAESFFVEITKMKIKGHPQDSCFIFRLGQSANVVDISSDPAS